MIDRTPAEIFSPGEFLKEELDQRGWSQQELADILDRPPRLVSEIVGGKRAITPETAVGLSKALGSSAEYWMNLESQYQLSKVKIETDSVARRARLYDTFPVRELLRKGWVASTDDLSVLERRFCEFFRITDISAKPSLAHAAKKTAAGSEPTVEQIAWLSRVHALAGATQVPRYSEKKLIACIEGLKALRSAPEFVSKVPALLADAGVQLVCVEPIAGSKIDGACFWIDSKPVVGMTLRFDRIDNFWFVLRHELEHVLRGDGKDEVVLDTEIGEHSERQSRAEAAANAAAGEFCTPQRALDVFVDQVAPYFSEEKVLAFAQGLSLHPGLVVGQLHRRLNRHDFLRKHQVKVRDNVLETALSDGWGFIATTRH
ncbi:MAG: HigA family addiction module antitoxin [Rubrivivax sp.]